MLICLGDSHSSVFSFEERIISQWPKKDFKIFSKFKPIRIGPATAYNLESKIILLNKVLNRTLYFKNTYVMFCFGEVDIRAHLIKQAELQNKQIDIVIKDCVDRYINAIKKVKPIRKINKAVFLKYLSSLFLKIIKKITKKNKKIKYAIFLCINCTTEGFSKELIENKIFKLESSGKYDEFISGHD